MHEGRISVIDACPSPIFWGEDFCDQENLQYYFKLMGDVFLGEPNKLYSVHSLALSILSKRPYSWKSQKIDLFPLLPISFFYQRLIMVETKWVYLNTVTAPETMKRTFPILKFLKKQPFTLCAGVLSSSTNPQYSHNYWPWIDEKWLTEKRYQSLLLKSSVWVIDGGKLAYYNPSLVHALLMAKILVCVGEALPASMGLTCNLHYFLVKNLREFNNLCLKLTHNPSLGHQMCRYNRLYAEQYLLPEKQAADIFQTLL
jgi:hypothetical protein